MSFTLRRRLLLVFDLHTSHTGQEDPMEDDDTSRHKRQRISPPLTPNIDDEDDMGVMSAGRESRAASDASSDWGDWADRQVAQGETPADNAAEAAGQSSAVDSSGENEEDDVWVRKQMEQPSAVLGADNRAWDYVLQQMILDEGEVCRRRAVHDAGTCAPEPTVPERTHDNTSLKARVIVRLSCHHVI